MPDAFGMTGMPGANFGGTNMAVPSPATGSTPAIGGATNPFGTPYPVGTQMPGMTSSINNTSGLNVNTNSGGVAVNPNNPLLPSNNNPSSGGVGIPGDITGLTAGLFGGAKQHNQGQVNAQGNWVPNQKDFINSMKKAGFSAGNAAMLFNFIQSGAGFNPDVANALIAAMQPQVQRKEADILEQFSHAGLRNGSPAAIGLADFLAQEQLNEGQIWAGLYEQSVQNYMNVLMGGKGSNTSKFDQILKFMQVSSQAAANGAAAAAA